MHVHMPERSVGQERAREAAHDWIRWHPLLERTYVTEGVHVRSRHVIPLLIPSPSLGFVSPRNAPRHAIPSASIGALHLHPHFTEKVLPTCDDLRDLDRWIELVEIYRFVQ